MKCLSTTWCQFLGQGRLFLVQNTLSRWWCRVFTRSEFSLISFARKIKLIRLTLALRSTHWLPLHRVPYRLLRGLPYRLPPRTTQSIQANLRLRGKATQEAYTIIFVWKSASILFLPTSSTQSIFIFVPFLYWHCWISISFICLKFLSSTLPFAKKYPKVNLFHLFVMPVLSRC